MHQYSGVVRRVWRPATSACVARGRRAGAHLGGVAAWLAKCHPERQLAPVVNFVSKSKANRGPLASAIAWHVSEGQAAYSQRWRASLLRTRSPARPPSTFAWEIKGHGSGSGSARFVEQPSTTRRKAGTMRSVSPSGRLPTQAFRCLVSPSTTAAAIHGCNCRRGRLHSRRIPRERVVSS